MPVTYQQLTSATLDQVKSDPELLNALAKAYGYDAGRLLAYWSSGYRNFNADKSYALSNLNPTSGGGLAKATDRYINLNNPDKPVDFAAAQESRKTAATELEQYANFLKRIGLDPLQVPQYQEYAGKVGVGTDGKLLATGQTSEETAIKEAVEVLKQTDGRVNPLSRISSDLELKAANAYEAFKKGTPEESSGTGTPSGTGEGGTGAAPDTGPDLFKPVENVAFKDTDAYKALPQDLKDFVDLSYNLIEVGGEEESRRFKEAIEQAKAIADPYFKTQLSLAQAEVLGSIAEKNNDFETKSEIIQRTRDELLADVSANKENLSLEQQSEIARAVQGYDKDLLSIADQAAERGLTFATGARSRALAEERRGAQFQDVVQSSNRKFNFKKRELELRAQRGDTAAQKQLESLQRDKTFGLQRVGRAAEEVLGSANLPSIEGFTPVGGNIGSIEEQKRKSITSDIGAFVDLQKGFI